MGPAETSKKRQIITVAAVLIVIVLLVTATVVANKKQDSSDVATDDSSTTSSTPTQAATNTATPSTETSATNTSNYKDGIYTADGRYQTPGGSQEISVEVTIADGKVTDSTVTSNASDRESKEYQSKFVSGYKAQVTGKSIDAISLSRVSGSSLTSQGFNDAIADIKNQAKA